MWGQESGLWEESECVGDEWEMWGKAVAWVGEGGGETVPGVKEASSQQP